MEADVIARAEHVPFADGSFEVVVSRIAPHHFADIRAAVAEMARVARRLVLVVDNLYRGDLVEEAERLRDPTHVRNYSDEEWREFFDAAGLDVEDVRVLEVQIELEPWLARASCAGAEADRVRELLAGVIHDGRLRMQRIAVKGRVR